MVFEGRIFGAWFKEKPEKGNQHLGPSLHFATRPSRRVVLPERKLHSTASQNLSFAQLLAGFFIGPGE